MNSTESAPAATVTNGSAAPVASRKHKAVVLLVDDQALIGEAVRSLIVGENDIELHHCLDPRQALATAVRVKPTVILQDLVMPDVDGLLLVKFYRAHPATRETPIVVLSTKEEPVVKAEAFARGANDYLVKLPDRLELVARLRYHSSTHILRQERNEAYAALAASRQRLASEMEAGTKYVESLLPKFLEGPVRVSWRYVPSAELGGDSLGYFWLDDDHLALFLLDVTGHGLASALLGVTVANLLRARSLPGADFAQPASVLAALNRTFQMEEHDGRFFTMWYAVFDQASRQLTWSGAGHPAAFLTTAGAALVQLESQGMGIGMMNLGEYSQESVAMPAGSQLYVYSDGAFEVRKSGGEYWTFTEFVDYMTEVCASSPKGASVPDALLNHVRLLKGADTLDDDFSIIEMCI